MPDEPDLSAAHRHYESGRHAEAEAACRGVLERHANDPDALHLLGVLAVRSGRVDEAVDCLRQAVRARPTSADTWNSLGVALEARGQLVKAENAYRSALRQRPRYPEALNNVGNTLRKQGRLGEAEGMYRAALAVRQDHVEALHGLAVALNDLGSLEEAVACYRRVVDLQPDSASVQSDLLQVLQHDPRETQPSLFEEARRWGRRHAEPHRTTWAEHPNERDPGRPLRVGYVSPDFRDHPIGRLVHPVLANHDRSAFRVYCYADVPKPDALTAGLRALADEWRDAAGLGDEALARRIREDRVDLLVDCAGHFGGNRLTMFARRPAPVQVSHFGYCATTGMTAMDYRVTDEASDPPGLTERYHTERLERLEGGCCWCYRPHEPTPDVGPLPALAAGRVTFGCLNRLNKVTDEVAAVWSRVLLAVPGSRLLLLSGAPHNPRLLDRFAGHGVAADQLELVGRRPRWEYLELHNRIDLGLDPFPFNGDNTVCDAVWMGVPSVALTGDGFVARRGLSHLRAVGLSELAADTRDRYVGNAVALAGDLKRLGELRAGLRGRLLSSPLGDAPGYVRRLEAAYRRMWRDWCGRPTAGGEVAAGGA